MRTLITLGLRDRALIGLGCLALIAFLSIYFGASWRRACELLTRTTHRAAAVAGQHDVVLVTIDSVRADHVGAYGYARDTTPHLDRLARRGVRFERAYAQAPHTSFSIAALQTGRHFGTLARLVPEARLMTLATWLAGHGFTTAAIYPPAVFVTDADKLAPYAADHFGYQHVQRDYLSADQNVDAAIAFFTQQRPERALLWVHLFEPHEPYQPGGAPIFGNRDIDRYDQELRVADAALGRLASYLAAHRPGATLIVTSDHGEAFDEHGERYHGTNLHDEQLRVPLIMAAPDLKPTVVREPVQLVDVFPTLAAKLGIPWPHGVEGHDLGARIDGNSPTRHAAHAAVEDQRAIVRGHHKLIWDLRRGTSQLFDLAADPHELRDVSLEQPLQASHLRSELYQFIDDQLRSAERLHLVHSTAKVPEPILRARLGDARATDELVNLFTNPSAREHWHEAAQHLLRLPPQRGTLATLLHLRAVDPLVRDWVSVALLRLGQEQALSSVVGILADSAKPFPLRLRAAEVLTFRKVLGIAPPLQQLLKDCPDVEGCREVITALGQSNDRSVLQDLVQRMSDPMVQREVIRALGQLGGPQALAALASCLRSDERALARLEAARALGKLTAEGARAVLAHASLHDPEQTVRDAAQAALDRLPMGQPRPGQGAAH